MWLHPSVIFLADWLHNSHDATLKWPTQPAFNCQNLTVHDSYFEPMVGILPSQIKDQDLVSLKTKYLSSTIYK